MCVCVCVCVCVCMCVCRVVTFCKERDEIIYQNETQMVPHMYIVY